MKGKYSLRLPSSKIFSLNTCRFSIGPSFNDLHQKAHLHVNSDVFISMRLSARAAIYLHHTQNRFSHLICLRCWQKHSITLAGCKFPAHWSSMMPQRSKTDWNLCSYSSISSVTWLCQHPSTVPPNKPTVLLAASCRIFTLTGKKKNL